MALYRCPVCSREFEADNSSVCTGVDTIRDVEEVMTRKGTVEVIKTTTVYSDDGKVLAEVRHYKPDHGAALMEEVS